MKQIILYCGNYDNGDIAWENSGNGVVFNAVRFYEKITSTHIKGRDLRQVEFRHKMSTRKYWDITISADELTDDGLFSFLKAFFKANVWKLRVDSVDYNVVLDDGDMPITYLENNKNLPEVSFILTQKEPD